MSAKLRELQANISDLIASHASILKATRGDTTSIARFFHRTLPVQAMDVDMPEHLPFMFEL